MNIKKSILGTIGVILVLIFLVALLGSGSDDSVSNTTTNQVTSDPKTEAVSTPQTEEASTPSTKGSYENPASMGETVVLTSSGNTFAVSILDVIRGEKANYLVKSANQFNDAPASGYEYLLVKAKVAYTKGKDPTDVSYLDFKAYVDGAEIPRPSVVHSNEFMKLDTGTLMPGGNKEGWVAFTVPQGKKVVIAFQPNMFDDGTASYLSIGN